MNVADPRVFIVILNTNRKDDTLECLSTVEKSTYENKTIIVLDNASTDGSIEAISNAFSWVQVIHLNENKGYAGNNNIGINAALNQLADWILILNEDTVMGPDCIQQMIDIGESDIKIGILGPMVYHYNEPDVIQSAGGHLDRQMVATHLGQNEKDNGQYIEPHLVDWISGCAILVKRSVIEQVGMLDERFFYYFEETEWCLRAKKNGWNIVHVPQAKLWHKGVERDYKPSPTVTYFSTRNQLLLLSTYNAPFRAWLFAWWNILRTLLSLTIFPKWKYMHENRDAMWQGVCDFIGRNWGSRQL